MVPGGAYISGLATFDTGWLSPSTAFEFVPVSLSYYQDIPVLETSVDLVAGQLYEIRCNFAADWPGSGVAGVGAGCSITVGGVPAAPMSVGLAQGPGLPGTRSTCGIWFQAATTGPNLVQFSYRLTSAFGNVVPGLKLYLDDLDIRGFRTPMLAAFSTHGGGLFTGCIASPFSMVAVFVSLGPAPAPLTIPGIRNEVLIDPSTAVLWRFLVVDASGQVRVDNLAGIPQGGVVVYWQALEQQILGTPQLGWAMPFGYR